MPDRRVARLLAGVLGAAAPNVFGIDQQRPVDFDAITWANRVGHLTQLSEHANPTGIQIDVREFCQNAGQANCLIEPCRGIDLDADDQLPVWTGESHLDPKEPRPDTHSLTVSAARTRRVHA